MSDFPGKAAPRGPGPSDWLSAMESLGQGNALPTSADDPRVVELLTHWDDLPGDLLGRVTEHPVHGPRLRHLRRVEAFLAGSTCPEAEELYDFARGPGYTPLGASRRQEVSDHLVHCPECEEMVGSLEANPPLPLDLSRNVIVPTPPPREAPPRPSVHRFERWIPLAVAATVLAVGLLVFKGGTVDAGDRWPAYPLLRGPSADELAFPRDRVLAPGSVPGGGWASKPVFEPRDVEGASSYRVVVSSHEGGAFGEGTVVQTLTGDRDELIAETVFDPGHYTWEAWAMVDGLDRLLGTRDFEIVTAAAVQANLGGLSELERVHCLHGAGYWTDARTLARRSRPGVGRDEYLNEMPGR